MLDLLGVEYLISYVGGVFRNEQRREFISAFISEQITALAKGKYLEDRLFDVLRRFDGGDQTERSGDEIAQAVIEKHGLRVTEEDEFI